MVMDISCDRPRHVTFIGAECIRLAAFQRGHPGCKKYESRAWQLGYVTATNMSRLSIGD